MNKRNYDNYFKSKKHDIKKDLINTYVKYDNKYLLSNGYGIVMVNEIPSNYTEQDKFKTMLCMQFDTWLNMKQYNDTETFTIDLSIIKTNLVNDNGVNCFKLDIKDTDLHLDYAINYDLLKKVISIIGYKELNIVIVEHTTNNIPIIEIIGKNNQVGYMLPMRTY